LDLTGALPGQGPYNLDVVYRCTGEAEVKTLYLPYETAFDEETSTWCLVGRDSAGSEFGVGASAEPEEAAARLRDWVLDSLLASASDGVDRLGDLWTECPPDRECLAFGPLDLIPVRIRVLRVLHGWRQSDMADRLGISQQAYGKLERPGSNPELQTLVRVERVLEAPLLEYA
jgi:DNA-binding XRE family transcriptional regulator